LAPNQGEHVSAHFLHEVSREKPFKEEIPEKIVTSMLFRDPLLIPPFLGNK
jgi:hypothetical protein